MVLWWFGREKLRISVLWKLCLIYPSLTFFKAPSEMIDFNMEKVEGRLLGRSKRYAVLWDISTSKKFALHIVLDSQWTSLIQQHLKGVHLDVALLHQNWRHSNSLRLTRWYGVGRLHGCYNLESRSSNLQGQSVSTMDPNLKICKDSL